MFMVIVEEKILTTCCSASIFKRLQKCVKCVSTDSTKIGKINLRVQTNFSALYTPTKNDTILFYDNFYFISNVSIYFF